MRERTHSTNGKRGNNNMIDLTIVFVSMLDDFADGNFFSGLMRPISNLIGDWTYGIFFGMLFSMIYFRSQSAIMPFVVFILLAPIVLFLLPAGAHPMYYIFSSLAGASYVFQAYSRRGG